MVRRRANKIRAVANQAEIASATRGGYINVTRCHSCTQPQITLYLLLPADLNGNLRAICTAKIETSQSLMGFCKFND